MIELIFAPIGLLFLGWASIELFYKVIYRVTHANWPMSPEVYKTKLLEQQNKMLEGKIEEQVALRKQADEQLYNLLEALKKGGRHT